MRKTLFVVSAKPDAGLSNEILHLIREDEKQRIDGLTEENLRIIVMNEDHGISIGMRPVRKQGCSSSVR